MNDLINLAAGLGQLCMGVALLASVIYMLRWAYTVDGKAAGKKGYHEPPPIGGGISVWPVVDGVAAEAGFRLHEAIKEAVAHGLSKYGTLLKTNNGRDASRDCVQEIADAAQYYMQLVLENPPKETCTSKLEYVDAVIDDFLKFRELAKKASGFTPFERAVSLVKDPVDKGGLLG